MKYRQEGGPMDQMGDDGSLADINAEEQNEQMRQLFIKWFAQKTGAESMEDVQSKAEELGEDGMKEAVAAFQAEMAASQEGEVVQQKESMRLGGKLAYIKCLHSFKKGGSIASNKCGCMAGKFEKKQEGGKTVVTKKKRIK